MSPSRTVFAVLLCVAPAFGAFPTGWLRQAKLTVQHAQVPADQTAFPVLVTAATLPNEMVTAGGANAAQSDGGDIRFSSDAAGSSQLACEIVIWTQNANPALAEAGFLSQQPARRSALKQSGTPTSKPFTTMRTAPLSRRQIPLRTPTTAQSFRV
jgi:hypothetical protein